MSKLPAMIVVFSLLGTAALADERPSRFYVHAGPALVDLADNVDMTAGGGVVPGADIHSDPQWTAAVEAGWFVTPHLAVSYTFGVPPTATVEGRGSIAPYGTLGETTYGPMAWMISYHMTDRGPVQPYVGMGVAYLHVFDAKDGVVTNLDVGDDVGLAFQVGADMMLTPRWGAFVDVKKAYLRPEFTGNLGPAPVAGTIQADPLVLSAGVAYRF